MALTKQLVIAAILKRLEEDLTLAVSAAETARDTATSKENVAENKYDTLGLEAAYLAHGQSSRAERLEAERKAFAALSAEIASESVIVGSLVSVVDEDDKSKWVFVGPGAAGLTLSFGDQEVVVVTAESPLGAGLLGLSLADVAQVNGRELEIADLQ